MLLPTLKTVHVPAVSHQAALLVLRACEQSCLHFFLFVFYDVSHRGSFFNVLEERQKWVRCWTDMR